MKRSLIFVVVTLSALGCAERPVGLSPASDVAPPAPGPSAWPTPDAPAAGPAPPLGASAPEPGGFPEPSDGSTYPVLRPRGTALRPATAGRGEVATLWVEDLPPNAEVTFWHTGQVNRFATGVTHPSTRNDAVAIGSATTSPEGTCAIAFVVPPADDPQQNAHVVWAVLPPGDVIWPNVFAWTSTYRTAVAGRVFDERGEPVDGGEVRLVVEGPAAYEAIAPIRRGRYAFDGVPAPGWGSFLLMKHPGFVERRRPFLAQDAHRQWAAAEGPLTPFTQPWRDAIGRHQGEPLAIDFGGPGTAADPDAPAYFYSARSDEPAFRTTAIAGRVFDPEGRPVPDDLALEVRVSAPWPSERDRFQARTDVRGGAYRLEGVPTGVSVSVYLNRVDLCASAASRDIVRAPTGVTGRDAEVNFGGPATAEDPDAAEFPYRLPDWAKTSQCAPPGPRASAPIP